MAVLRNIRVPEVYTAQEHTVLNSLSISAVEKTRFPVFILSYWCTKVRRNYNRTIYVTKSVGSAEFNKRGKRKKKKKETENIVRSHSPANFHFRQNFKVKTPYVRYELSCIEGAEMIHIAM